MQLDKYLESKEISRQEFADFVGISRTALNNYIWCVRVPSLIVAKRIVDATKGEVTLDDLIDEWYRHNDRD